MLCLCSDSIPLPAPTPKPSADYLVMVYGVGGKTLDCNIIANIMQTLDVGSDEKVKGTFQYKLFHYKNGSFPCRSGHQDPL